MEVRALLQVNGADVRLLRDLNRLSSCLDHPMDGIQPKFAVWVRHGAVPARYRSELRSVANELSVSFPEQSPFSRVISSRFAFHTGHVAIAVDRVISPALRAREPTRDREMIFIRIVP